jgi:Bacterial Ig-like domain (group 2)
MKRLPFVALLGLAPVVIAACDTANPPTIAGIGPVITTPIVVVAPRIVILPSQVFVGLGAIFQLRTNAPADLVNQIQWNTLNGTVATVSPTGVVNAVGVGTAVITARFAFDTLNVDASVVNVSLFGPTTVVTTMRRP